MVLRIENKRVVWTTATGIYPIPTAVLALLVILVSYLGARLGATMVVSSHGLSVLWPPSALIVAAMLLVPRRNWLVLLPAGLAGAAIENLQLGFTLGATGLFFLADAIQFLIIGLGLAYSFDGVPRLNSPKALAKYCFFAALLGPFVGAFIGANAPSGSYAVNWRVWFFSEMVSFLTITPAILSWASPRSLRAYRSVESRLEMAALMIALIFVGYVIFFIHWRTIPPALLYSLVPFLLWAALRFGSQGVSTSIVVIVFCSIWGAVHGRGPFTGANPVHATLLLQLFLVFAAAPFMVLAAVVEERASARLVERELSRRLISAQEQERSRIARELHDDICQRLALLSMEVDQANHRANESAHTTTERLKDIRLHCSEIASDVQLLSHELHSSRLDYLGIEAAIRGFCHEFSKQHEVSIEFTDGDVPAEMPKDISLCLFRVAQEALHNAVKYSGVSQYAVELTATAKEIQLVVSDSGRGFDVEAVKQNRGLGLVSMQERVYLVNGSLHVESAPGKGTKILAVVPLVGKRQESPENDRIEEPEGVARPA